MECQWHKNQKTSFQAREMNFTILENNSNQIDEIPSKGNEFHNSWNFVKQVDQRQGTNKKDEIPSKRNKFHNSWNIIQSI